MLNTPCNANSKPFPQVGFTQACRVLAALGIMECAGNDLDPILISSMTPASDCFAYTEYANEDVGTPDLFRHHERQLTQHGVKFGRNAFKLYDLHLHQNPCPIQRDGQGVPWGSGWRYGSIWVECGERSGSAKGRV